MNIKKSLFKAVQKLRNSSFPLDKFWLFNSLVTNELKSIYFIRRIFVFMWKISTKGFAF